MIRGVGIDLVEVERVQAALSRWGVRFLERVFAPEEIEDARRGADFAASLAARFAAKEAAYKAVREAYGRPIPLRAIIVSARRGQAPRLAFSGGVAGALGGVRWWCSLAHSRGLACAVVVAETSPR